MISFPNWYACHPICTGCAHRRCNGSSADVDVSRLTQVCVCVCGRRGWGVYVGAQGAALRWRWNNRFVVASPCRCRRCRRIRSFQPKGCYCSRCRRYVFTHSLSLSLSVSLCVCCVVYKLCRVDAAPNVEQHTHTHSYMYVMQFSTLSPFAIYTLYTWAAWQFRGADVHACTRINNLVRRSLLLLLVVGSGLAGRGTGSPTFMLYNM